MTTRSTRIPAALAGIAALFCAPTSSAGPREQETQTSHAVPFITVSGDQLVEGEAPFRFISFNIPNLHYVEDDMAFEETNPWRFPNEFEISDALEAVRRQGGTVVRFYTLSVRKAEDRPEIPRHVLGPGEFDEEAFRTLDRVMEVAGRTSADPGERYYYRVRARNAAGASEPSNTVGPVEYESSVLVDELRGWSEIYSHSPGLQLQRATARRAKEDFDRLLVKPGSFVVYKVDAPIRGFRAYAFFPDEVEDFSFSLSEDGVAYVPAYVAREEYFEVGEFAAAAYGYWRPISFALEEAPTAARYLRIEFPTDAELSRIEIRYGGDGQPEEPATAPSSS